MKTPAIISSTFSILTVSTYAFAYQEALKPNDTFQSLCWNSAIYRVAKNLPPEMGTVFTTVERTLQAANSYELTVISLPPYGTTDFESKFAISFKDAVGCELKNLNVEQYLKPVVR